jgi:hypothetical protein
VNTFAQHGGARKQPAHLLGHQKRYRAQLIVCRAAGVGRPAGAIGEVLVECRPKILGAARSPLGLPPWLFRGTGERSGEPLYDPAILLI